MQVNYLINGISRNFDIQAGDMLLDTLRKNDYLSVKKSCSSSACGICTVLIDDKPILSCSYPSAKADGHKITTIEGVMDEAERIATCISSEGADQCGFCNPSLILTVISLKKMHIDYEDEAIKKYLVGNTCRCSGYEAQLRGIKKYLEVGNEISK